MRFEGFMAVKIWIVVVLIVMLCNLLGGNQCFGGTCCLHLQVEEDGVPLKC
jgi:hypothetical protein